jgi:hypothetical protein
LTSIINDNVTTPPCQAESTARKESLQRIQDPNADSNTTNNTHDLVITNTEASVIIEVCPTGEKSFTLPLAARVRIQKECTFKLINGPEVKELIPMLEFTKIASHVPNSKDTVTVPVKKESFLEEEIEDVKEHFEQHSYIYIIVLTVTVTIMIACTGCCHYCLLKRVPARHESHVESDNDLPPYTVDEPPSQALQLLPSSYSVI